MAVDRETGTRGRSPEVGNSDSFGENVVAALAKYVVARRERGRVAAGLKSADRAVGATENPNIQKDKNRTIAPKSGTEPVEAKQERLRLSDGEEDGQFTVDTAVVDADNPFHATSLHFDFERETVTFTRHVDSHNDRFSNSGHRIWWELEIPISDLDRFDVVDVDEETEVRD